MTTRDSGKIEELAVQLLLLLSNDVARTVCRAPRFETKQNRKVCLLQVSNMTGFSVVADEGLAEQVKTFLQSALEAPDTPIEQHIAAERLTVLALCIIPC